jgi:hypothetical protein
MTVDHGAPEDGTRTADAAAALRFSFQAKAKAHPAIVWTLAFRPELASDD